MKLEQLCQKYDELYDALTEVLKESNYSDVAIVDELSTGIRGSLKSEINESYLKFFEYVVKKQGVYDGGQSPSELFSFLKMSISNGNTSFPLVKGIEAPLSLKVIYLVRGELESVLKPTESLFYDKRKLEVSDAQARRFQNGGALDVGRTALKNAELNSGELIRIKRRGGAFLGLGRYDNGMLKIGFLNEVQTGS